LRHARDWCLTVIGFFREVNPEFDPHRWYERDTENAYRLGNLRGFPDAVRHLLFMVSSATYEQKKVLDARLREKFGRGLKEEYEAEQKKLQRVLDRGRIAGEREYYLVREQADWLDPESDRDLLAEVDRLVYEFESRKSKTKRG
jgi:hypothetical protein